MVAQTAQAVYNEILAHINEQGGAKSNWYCGIASDWEARLFEDHNVPRKDHWRTARQCFNDTDSRAVEKSLLELGCDGGSGGGDNTTVYVYAYLKSSVTDP